MLPAPVYYAILLVCWGYALLRGGAPERIGASIIGVGSILSTILATQASERFIAVEAGVLLVDVAALAAFVLLAVRADRFWPLWVAALQLVGTAGHAVKLADPTVIRLAYAFILALWTYPMLLLVMVGTWYHQKRLRRFGADRSWSSFSSPSRTMQKNWPAG